MIKVFNFSVLFLLSIVLTLLSTSLAQSNIICPPVQACLANLSRSESCSLLPLPRASLREPLPPSGFRLQQVRDNVFVYDDSRYFPTMIKHKQRLVLIDFPNSPNSFDSNGNYLFLNATRQVLNGTVPTRVDMIYGHRHFDHIGQAKRVKDYFRERFPEAKLFVWGTSEVNEFVLREEMTEFPVPNVVIGPFGQSIHLSPELSIRLSIIGGHTAHDVLIHIPPSDGKNGFIYLVDFITPDFAPWARFGLSVDLGRYITAQKDILKLDFNIFNPGHGRLGSKTDIMRNIRYSEDVMKFVSEAQAAITPEQLAEFGVTQVGDPNAVQFGNTHFAINQLAKIVTESCIRRLIEKYGCELAGVDVFGPGHCESAYLQSLVEDQSMII